MGPLVPCPIVFPGSRRTSKTLAVAAPDSGVGGNTAGWLGFVGLPALPEGKAAFGNALPLTGKLLLACVLHLACADRACAHVT